MKKLAALFLLALAATSYAALETGGTIGNPLVDRDATTKKLVLTTRIVDSNGNTVGAFGGVSVTSAPAMTPRASVGFTWSQTPTPYNLSATAGVAGSKYIVTVMPRFGGAGTNNEYGSVTVTANLLAGLGIYIPTTVTGGVAYGPFTEGTIWVGASSTSTNVTGVIHIDTVP